MATVQDLKRRIRSIRNTRKITKAMELVASARLRRAQARIEAMRPYADRMMELMIGTARASSSLRSLPLLQRHESVQSVAILPLTGDRGLAGAFNAQVLRHAFALARRLESEGMRVRWLVSGRKGASTLRFRRLDVLQAWTGFSDRPAYADAQALAHKVADLYVENEVDRVVVVYNRFVSPLVQQVVEQDLLPIPEEVLEAGEDTQHLLGDFIYEPEPEQILARLLPVYVETELYRALLESAASEQGARMTAMRNASKNAGELIDTLTLAMNRARQAEITQEILEVVAGADALTQ
jgi:F-type H+-transporting ATPase subunit gamma